MSKYNIIGKNYKFVPVELPGMSHNVELMPPDYECQKYTNSARILNYDSLVQYGKERDLDNHDIFMDIEYNLDDHKVLISFWFYEDIEGDPYGGYEFQYCPTLDEASEQVRIRCDDDINQFVNDFMVKVVDLINQGAIK